MSETVIDLSVGKIFTRISNDVSRLIQAEVQIAKREIREDLGNAIRSIVAGAVAAMAGYIVLIFLSLAVMFGLGAIMPLGWAALIVGVLWAVAAGVLLARAKRMMKEISGAPKARHAVKEDVSWITTH